MGSGKRVEKNKTMVKRNEIFFSFRWSTMESAIEELSQLVLWVCDYLLLVVFSS